MGRAKTTKKAASRISKKAEDRIVELSLKNPDFGARRLVPLLKDSKIDVSTSKVYSILKRRGLQTRTLRLVKLDEMGRAKDAPAPQTAPTPITPEIEEQIVEVSLQNPDNGARRLAGLLGGEGIIISSSALYTLLKRHGLQNRSLRLARIEAQRPAEVPAPVVEVPAPYAAPMPELAEEPEGAPAVAVEISQPSAAAPLPQAAVTPTPWARGFFYLANLLLLALVGYLGYYAVLNFKQARLEPEAVAAIKPAPVRLAAQPKIAVQPLKGYRKIWERNLFNIKEEKAPAAEKEIPIEEIALAQKDIGLKLMGTVLADDSSLSRAIVHNQKTRQQEAYREGDQAGKVKIKKILRSKVIITTAKGDQLLTVDAEDSGKRGRASSKQRRAPMSLTSPQASAREQISGSTPRRTRSRSISLNRDEVEATLADTDRLLQELTISAFTQGEQPAGFIISNIPRGSILTKMGLRNGYVVTQLNDQAITSPDQAADFFSTLAEGGEVSINVRRSRAVRRRSRQINLNIE